MTTSVWRLLLFQRRATSHHLSACSVPLCWGVGGQLKFAANESHFVENSGKSPLENKFVQKWMNIPNSAELSCFRSLLRIKSFN
ncbi:hypothetical protein JOB18_029846 [Solea senegalensis]|uniref:Secreted protein n=1 Tax=Solea senegalensis TaxID=28829 RepID=A0AAV6RRG7_SOLSE|nr:hypothetical protein JOB18_029846 [Solea senegalensis]